jgi:hypothetical protein
MNPRRRLPDRPIPASEPGRHRTEGVTQVLARPLAGHGADGRFRSRSVAS